MNRLGIQSLNAGAPDLRLSGDQTQRGTYTQRRRTQMAGGGIMGSNAGSMLVAPTADGSRPGYADWWKPGSMFQKYIKDPFEMIITGKNPTQIENESQARVDREENIVRDIPADFDPTTDRLADITPTDPGTGPYTPWYEQIFKGSDPTNPDDPLSFDVGDVFGMGKDQYGKYTIPMAIGTAMGKLQQDYLDKQPKFPADETRIKFQTAKQHMEDPEQRIKPQEKYVLPSALVAEGGRIGYQDGMMAKPSYGVEDHFRKDMVENLIEKLKKENPDATLSELITMLNERYGLAQGGRIGYARGLGPATRKGLPSLDMDMEWGGPEQIELSSAREEAFEEDPLFASRIMKLEAEHERDVSNYEKQDLEKRIMKYIRDAGGSYKVPETSYWKALSAASEAGDEEVRKYLATHLYGGKMGNRYAAPMGAAQGGRIGYSNGGIYEKALMDAWRTYQDQGGTLSLEKFADEWMKAMMKGKAQGGRIGAQEGGLMDLGGMEKDYREEGGFVPIGGREKADDVPARLSKNEFVFTADAVRSAGGGDIDEGAAVMERLMENLEAGGKVSEESQGLEGARNMFANAQQLEKRII